MSGLALSVSFQVPDVSPGGYRIFVHDGGIDAQLLVGNGVIVFTHIDFNGQVVFDVPGQAGRPDLWSCTIAEAPGAVVVAALLTPRR
jgi:hypothetical protein